MYDYIDIDDPNMGPDIYSESADTDGNGVDDTFLTIVDENYDGVPDVVIRSVDYDQDGLIDQSTAYADTTGDGNFDVMQQQMDLDHDGVMETVETHYDFDADGIEDASETTIMADVDGDGMIETAFTYTDMDGDGQADMAYASIYNIETGEVHYVDLLEYDLANVDYTPLPTYDPAASDPEMVSGTPETSMELWECQGNTERCALYSQMFVIEELTGQDIDIDELAQLATENGWFDEESGTPMLNMNKVLDYYGVESEMTFHNTIDDLKECLDNGGKVIVAVDSGEIWFNEQHNIFSPMDGADHAVEVIGIDYTDPDNPMVILNDSGTPHGCGEMVPLAQFENAWADSDGQMVACYA